jgi:hypothetical protein
MSDNKEIKKEIKKELTPKEMRLAFAAAKQANKPEEVVDYKEEFRKFFLKEKEYFKFDKDMEAIIWAHFNSAGFTKPEKFQEGLEHFGYKRK